MADCQSAPIQVESVCCLLSFHPEEGLHVLQTVNETRPFLWTLTQMAFHTAAFCQQRVFSFQTPDGEKKTLPADRFSSCTQPVWKGRKGEKTEMVPDFALKNYTVFY